ncbi:MAG: hypothetical protein ISR90_06660 [Candidatus Marinimicrobia bacterium]|nr:hypothetical protein [Candidatus Neomarinimicrobiota bacterium]MBL7023713.1 hypothetical protein [Candidatus Neomarinimicrobiota bacterium]MBL7109494.1 hypothetical protein [Candidatus Neomarinimicrobiota bacterium]
MFGFIAFALKLLFATVLGGALAYVPGKANGDVRILYSSLISVLSASILGLAKQLPAESIGIFAGAGVLSVFIAVLYLSKNSNVEHKILFLFSASVGIIVGWGFFLQAVVLTILVYFVVSQGEKLLTHIEPEEMSETTDSLDNIDQINIEK